MSNRPVIVQARRTAIGRAGGQFADLEPEDLIRPLFHQLLEDTAIDPGSITDVILGNAVGGGGNIARLALLHAGLPETVPGLTIDRQCSSGLDAVIMAARLIEAGAGDVFLAGGVESTSRAPLRARPPREKGANPEFYTRAKHVPDTYGDPSMGEAAENVAQHFSISRDEQDAYALNSHKKALDAQQTGRFDAEIVTVLDPGEQDECPRASLTPELLARQRPSFRKGGTVTPGNSCPLNDGAALCLILSETKARTLGFTKGIAFVDAATSGTDPQLLGIGPISSTRHLFDRLPGHDLSRIDQIEFNEAFASQTLACLSALDIAHEKVCPAGGALALGHPFGASGAILVTRLFNDITQGRAETGLAMLGVAGGMGVSALFERWSG